MAETSDHMPLAELLVATAGLYSGIGLAFALWFVISGIDRLDPAARGAGPFFRALILPGAAALWPMLLLRCVRRPAHD